MAPPSPTRCNSALATSSRTLLALIAILGLGGPAVPAGAKVFHSQKEAIELAFPDADRVETRTLILTGEQTEVIQREARSKLDSRIVKLYHGYRDDQLLGHAFIDVHVVRTLPEAFLVVLTPEGKVASLRVLAFHEPLEYMPAPRWYHQFESKGLEDDLRLGRDIHGILGATLSTRAVTESVRRVLALYRVLIQPQGAANAVGRDRNDREAKAKEGRREQAAR